MTIMSSEPFYSRLSSNITTDGAISSFDIIGAMVPTQGSIPDTIVDGYDIFPIRSNHTRGKDTAYVIRRQDQSFVETPVSMGIPMNYASVPRVRFKALSNEMTEPEPFLMVPNSGFGQQYAGRAKSFEFWINAEPYARLTKTNILPASISTLEFNGGDYTLLNGTVSKLVDDEYPSAYSDTLRFSQNAQVVFRDTFGIVGGKRYKFSTVVRSDVANSILTASLETENYGSISIPVVIQNAGVYEKQEISFTISETIPQVPARLRLTASTTIDVSEPALIDLATAEESVVLRYPLIQMSVGNGGVVSIDVDAHYMYLTGYGNTDNYQVSEWARPMYIVLTDTGDTIDLYIDANLAMSINKGTSNGGYSVNQPFTDDFNEDFGFPIVNDGWIFFFLSPALKYIDLSTVTLYADILLPDIQKLHYMFSYGPSYNDVINYTQHENIYVADGSATTWSSRILFPKTTPFSTGSGNGLTIGNYLSLPEYEYPTLDDTTYEDINLNLVRDTRYGPNNFTLPFGAEMKLRLLTIDTNVSHIFLGVSPSDLSSATICRLSSKNLNYKCDIKIEENEAIPGQPKTFHIYAQFTRATASGQTYEDYDIDKPYKDDPNYIVLSYKEVSGLTPPWWDTDVPDRDFVLCLNFDELIKSTDNDVVRFFSEPDITLGIIDQIPIRFISCASTSIVNANAVEANYPNTTEGIRGIGTVPNIDVIGRTNYTFYASNTGLDIAAAGYWTTSIPLATMATFLSSIGRPDLDFVLYFDQLQSPQLVSSLTKDVMSYYELSEQVRTEWADLVDPEDIGQYTDIQAEYTDDPYGDVGVQVSTDVPTLGRFVDRNINTYVTLDSPLRWPYKTYSSLKIERATPSNYIDFDRSPNSVTDTKWEIYDGYGIRFPSNIDLYKYNLRVGVHIHTKSLNTKRPRFNRMELFGIASGDTPANTIAVGTGPYIIVGENAGVNSGQPFSTHLSPELTQSNYFHRENGFFPHYDYEAQKVIPVNFYLTEDKEMSSVSFYMCWRGEVFNTNSSREHIATIRHFYGNEQAHTDVLVQTDDTLEYAYQRGSIQTNNDYVNIYVDGVEDGPIEVGRWHLIQLNFEEPEMSGRASLANISRVVKFSLVSEKVIVNYITAHTANVYPPNLFASRFGLTDHTIFPGPDEELVVAEQADIHILGLTGEQAEPDAILKVSYSD